MIGLIVTSRGERVAVILSGSKLSIWQRMTMFIHKFDVGGLAIEDKKAGMFGIGLDDLLDIIHHYIFLAPTRLSRTCYVW